MTGYDYSERFIEFARKLPAPDSGTVTWVVGDAEQLPFAEASFDRVLLSLVLHQLARPVAAVGEAFRVLRGGGPVLVRTIAPEDVAERVPERYLPRWRPPTLHAFLASRRSPIGFKRQVSSTLPPSGTPGTRSSFLAEQERELQVEVRCRYPFITTDEVDQAVERMRTDAAIAGDEWIDPRPTYMTVGSKPS